MPGVEPGSARILLSLRASDDSRYTTSDGNAIIFQIKINILPKNIRHFDHSGNWAPIVIRSRARLERYLYSKISRTTMLVTEVVLSESAVSWPNRSSASQWLFQIRRFADVQFLLNFHRQKRPLFFRLPYSTINTFTCCCTRHSIYSVRTNQPLVVYLQPADLSK